MVRYEATHHFVSLGYRKGVRKLSIFQNLHFESFATLNLKHFEIPIFFYLFFKINPSVCEVSPTNLPNPGGLAAPLLRWQLPWSCPVGCEENVANSLRAALGTAAGHRHLTKLAGFQRGVDGLDGLG